MLKQIIYTGLLFLSCSGGLMAQDYLSPCDIDLSTDKNTLYVTAATGKKVLCVDTRSKKVTREFSLDLTPSGLVQETGGKHLFITAGKYNGKVLQSDSKSGKIQKDIAVGHTPMSPVLSPDGGTLYVCNRFNNDVSIINLEKGKTIARIPVLREPVAADLTPDGKYLFVANHIPDGAANLDYVASKVSVINTQSLEVITIPLVNGAEGLRGLKLSPDGKYVYVTHLMARYLVPTTQLERGWISTDALSVIRVSDLSLQYTVLLDDVDQGFTNPWAIGFSDDGNTLIVSAAGIHEISLINLPEMTRKIEAETGNTTSEVHLNTHNNLSFLQDIRKRIKLNGNGPRAIAVDGNTAYVTHYFSDALEVLDFSNPDNIQTTNYQLAADVPITAERQGEIYFNDASLCFQNWLSCATCHPDARTDALNWDLLNDGMGNPKNVKSMLLSHETPRAMWLGVRADAETGVRAGLKYIQFAVRPEKDAKAIDAYLKSLEPETSPFLINGKLSKAAKRGKKIYEKQGCAYCHPAPLYTNMKMYDLGTTIGQDVGKKVDTPLLIEAWRTAPYLHDGRAASLHEVFTIYNPDDKHGKTSELSEKEIDDMVEYLRSL